MSKLAYAVWPSRLFLASTLVLALGLGGVVLTAAGAATAAGQDKTTRKQYTVGESLAKKLNAVIESLNAEDYSKARELLDPLSRATKKQNAYERALVYQMLGLVASAEDAYEKAIDYLEKSLSEDALPEATQNSLRFNVVQLLMATQRYAEAVAALEQWFENVEEPSAQAYYLLAVAHYELEQYDAAIPAIERAIELSRQPNESWYQLLVGLYMERKAYKKALDPLERLIMLNPKKSYWKQLSALYANVGSEVRSLAVYQLAYEAGLLESESELQQLAHLYLYHEMPYPAATLLQEAIEANRLDADDEVWLLLANSWLLAREPDRALPALEEAAKLSVDGEVYARIGQVHVQNESWRDASVALRKALDKGGLDDEANVNLLLGISLYHQQKRAEARKHFASAKAAAGEEAAARRSAVQWLTVLAREGES